jgi:hypothetical protein
MTGSMILLEFHSSRVLEHSLYQQIYKPYAASIVQTSLWKQSPGSDTDLGSPFSFSFSGLTLVLPGYMTLTMNFQVKIEQ